MSIQDQIAAAKLKAIDDWDAGHKNCDFGSKERAGGMRDGFGDGFEVGYLAALRSLFFEVKPEDLGNKYHDHIWVRLKDGVWHESSGINGGFVYLLRAETDGYIYRSWTEKRPADEVDLVVGLADLPSPSDLFTEGRA